MQHDTTETPKRHRKPEPPGSSTARTDKLRKSRAAENITEIRGVYAPTVDHAALKAELKRLIEAKGKK